MHDSPSLEIGFSWKINLFNRIEGDLDIYRLLNLLFLKGFYVHVLPGSLFVYGIIKNLDCTAISNTYMYFARLFTLRAGLTGLTIICYKDTF